MQTHHIKRLIFSLFFAVTANIFYAMENEETFESTIAKAMMRFQADGFPTLPPNIIAHYADPNIQLLDRICREKNTALAEQFFTIESETEQARHFKFLTAFSQYNALIWQNIPSSFFNADTAKDALQKAVTNTLARLKKYDYPTLPDDGTWELATDNLRILDKICFERNPDAAQEFFLVSCENELERLKNFGADYNQYVALLAKYIQAPSSSPAQNPAAEKIPVMPVEEPAADPSSYPPYEISPWHHTCDVTDKEMVITISCNPECQNQK